MIISIDAQKAFDKFQHLFIMIAVGENLIIGGKFLTLIFKSL